jgi:cytochrome P450
MGVVAVTGHDEAVAMYRDTEAFSSCASVSGPFPPLSFTPEGGDTSEQIEAHRDQFPMHEHMVTFAPPRHTRARALLSRLLTPRRLKENEGFMWQLACRQLDEFLANGKCEFLREYARLFSMLVIADLLGVPKEDHNEVRRVLASMPGAAQGIWSMCQLRKTRWNFWTACSCLHRGSPPETPRGCADVVGGDEVPGRIDPRGARSGWAGDLPVWRRAGNHHRAAYESASTCTRCSTILPSKHR